MLSEVELRRTFDVCIERWANSVFACICREKYALIHKATPAIRSLFVCKCSIYPGARPVSLGRGFVLHFHTRSTRNTALASSNQIYYFCTNECETRIGPPFTNMKMRHNSISLNTCQHEVNIVTVASLGGSVQHRYCHVYRGWSILRSSKTLYAQGPLFCALGSLFCALVREEAIFTESKRYAHEGFPCMCKEIYGLKPKSDGRCAHCSCENALLTFGLGRGFVLHWHLQCAKCPLWPPVSKYTRTGY